LILPSGPEKGPILPHFLLAQTELLTPLVLLKVALKRHNLTLLPIGPDGTLPPLTFFVLGLRSFPSQNHFTLKMKAVWSSKMLVP